MPRKNIIFAIVAPLVLMAIIAAIVVSVGETLLATHEWAHHYYYVGDHPTEELNRHWREIAALIPVQVALGLAVVFLLGGIVASWMAPQPKAGTH
ncbi:MAG: hypothetical protein AB7P40_27315 [Chloroflexota bacterium]